MLSLHIIIILKLFVVGHDWLAHSEAGSVTVHASEPTTEDLVSKTPAFVNINELVEPMVVPAVKVLVLPYGYTSIVNVTDEKLYAYIVAAFCIEIVTDNCLFIKPFEISSQVGMNYIVSEYVVPPEEVTLRAIVCPGTIVKLLIPIFTRLTVYVDVLIK